KLGTLGAKSILPSNHGLTVWRSVEVTSVRWLAMSERTWLERTSPANCWSADLERSIGDTITASRRTAASDDAAAVQRHQALTAVSAGVFSCTPASARRASRTRILSAAGAAK